MAFETTKSTEDNFELIAQVYGRVQDTNAEQQYIGVASSKGTIHEGALTVTTMHVNSGVAYVDDYATIRHRMAPIKLRLQLTIPTLV